MKNILNAVARNINVVAFVFYPSFF